jgi:hypothetical protein
LILSNISSLSFLFRLLLTTGGKRRDAASHPLRFDWSASGSLADVIDTKQARTIALQSKKEKAAEPGREALAAF